MNELSEKEQYWPGLIVGGFMALIPSFDRFAELGDPSHWPMYKNLLPTMDVIFTTCEIPRPIYTSVIYYSLY